MLCDQAAKPIVRIACLSRRLFPSTIANTYIRLAAVNFFLGCVGVTQVTRIVLYQQSLKDKPAEKVAEDNAKDAAAIARGVVQDPEGAAKKAVN